MRGFIRRSAWILFLIGAVLVVPRIALTQSQFARSHINGADVYSDPAVARAYLRWQAGQYDEVLALVRPPAGQGDSAAQFLMGEIYSRGEGVPKDDEQAVSWWRKAADQGVPEAQNELGVALTDGRGAGTDYEQAVLWYRKAADQGLAVAQVNLGSMYLNGFGVRRDDGEAVSWYRKAAEQGLAWAQLYLGNAYAWGRGVNTSADQACKWYHKAADQEYPEAEYALGDCYSGGADISRDNARAVYWLARAARHGHELADKKLETIIPLLRKIQMHAAAEVKDKPDAMAAVIKTAGEREYAYVLDRQKDWVEVYFEDGHAVGYINAEQLRKK